MRQYVLKRLLLVVPTLLLVSIIVFSLTRLIPGDVVVLMFEEKAYAEDLEALRAKLGLNQPIYVQYGIWLSQVVQGNLGESLWTKRPVLDEIARRLPVSFELGAMAIVFGLLGAAHRGAGRDPAGHYEGLCGAQPGDHWAVGARVLESDHDHRVLLHLVRVGTPAAVHPVHAGSLAAHQPIHPSRDPSGVWRIR